MPIERAKKKVVRPQRPLPPHRQEAVESLLAANPRLKWNPEKRRFEEKSDPPPEAKEKQQAE